MPSPLTRSVLRLTRINIVRTGPSTETGAGSICTVFTSSCSASPTTVNHRPLADQANPGASSRQTMVIDVFHRAGIAGSGWSCEESWRGKVWCPDRWRAGGRKCLRSGGLGRRRAPDRNLRQYHRSVELARSAVRVRSCGEWPWRANDLTPCERNADAMPTRCRRDADTMLAPVRRRSGAGHSTVRRRPPALSARWQAGAFGRR